MKIYLTWGTGEGKTSAFDDALWDAGIANYNLIRLSSVIPDGSEVVIKKINWNSKEHGYKLYAVISEAYENEAGKNAVAGLGWATTNRAKGKGIFVGAGGNDRNAVSRYIQSTIKSMTSYRPEEHGRIKVKFAERGCKGNVACVVVAAVYKSEGW